MPKPIAIITSAAFSTLKATICAVIVVPTLAPMMTPIDCDIVISPADTKPTTSTIVTDELWITEVTKAPLIAAENRFLVSFDNSVFIWSPAAALRPSDICSMPNRNSASPPNSSIAILSQFSCSGFSLAAQATNGVRHKITTPTRGTNERLFRNRFTIMSPLPDLVIKHQRI